MHSRIGQYQEKFSNEIANLRTVHNASQQEIKNLYGRVSTKMLEATEIFSKNDAKIDDIQIHQESMNQTLLKTEYTLIKLKAELNLTKDNETSREIFEQFRD